MKITLDHILDLDGQWVDSITENNSCERFRHFLKVNVKEIGDQAC